MSAKLGAREVVGVDAVRELVDVANANAHANGLASYHAHHAHSTDLVTVPYRCAGAEPDVIVGELLDTELIGEGALVSMRHAMSTFAGRSPLAIPASAVVHCEVIESSWMWNRHCVQPVVEALGASSS